MTMQKWFDLRDRISGAKLKLGRINGNIFLFVVGISRNSVRWSQAIEKLGFQASPNAKFLIRMVAPEERIKLSWIREVWPDAVNAMMTPEQFSLKTSSGKGQAGEGESEEDRRIQAEINNARRLGRNADGDEVYEGGAGRFVVRKDRVIVPETRNVLTWMFLRASGEARSDEALAMCADGFVRSMDMGEVQHSEEFIRFVQAITGQAKPSQEAIDEAHAAVDAAVIRHLARRHDTSQDAFGDAGRLYEYLPPYLGSPRGKGAMPIPLSVIAQRLLGDTSDQVVLVPNAYDGAAFAFLPPQSRVRAYRGGKDLSAYSRLEGSREVEWLDEFNPSREVGVDNIFFNADPALGPDGARKDYRDALSALRSLKPGGRAVLVLAGDDPLHPGRLSAQSTNFLATLGGRYHIEEVFEVAAALTQRVGTDSTLRVIALANARPGGLPEVIPVVHSWDEVKARVDEAIVRAQVREAESEGVDVEAVANENVHQSPYLAFSRVSEARTMVPRNLQAPLQAALSDLEGLYGPIDDFVAAELGFGENTLGDRLSAEQVDALGLILARMKTGRGAILADETGIGKGRTLAALATWANKNGKPVVFITDRANLFSDLARDLRDIGEWGRFRALITNTDGQIIDAVGDGGVLAEGESAESMRRILGENISLQDLDRNIVFTTYSQIAAEGSEKAVWIKNQLKDALLVIDEAHLAAGSDSNVAAQITEMSHMADAVVYSSATWAKTPKNLHIYARAFPETVNISSLTKTMKSGGESFAEVFSGMLARDGALIRREHDLSKLEFVIEIDKANAERNNQVADRISEVMGQIAYVGGNLDRMMFQLSQLSLDTLREAREARGEALKVSIFRSGFGTGSMLYQVQRRMNAALNVDNAVRLAKEHMALGHKPVIVFEDTGESFINAAIEAQTTQDASGRTVLPEMIAAPTVKDLMRKILDDLAHIRVAQVDERILDDGVILEGGASGQPGDAAEATEADEVVIQEVLSATEVQPPGGADGATAAEPRAGEPEGEDDEEEVRVLRKRAKRVKVRYARVHFAEVAGIPEDRKKSIREGLDEIAKLIEQLPDLDINIPDAITNRLSAEGLRVGEISGRKYGLRAVEGVAGQCQIYRRPKKKSFVNATVRAYNGGDLDVVLINRSGATGISLHASPRFADRRRRVLIEMQIPEDPTNRIQLYGRVNRFDQESFPIIACASTGIFGEVRQLMLQNKKLYAMSANVRSSRENFAEIKDVPDLLTPIGREVCEQFLRDNPAMASRMGVDLKKLEEGVIDPANMLTQRVSLLRVREQKLVYEQIQALFDDAVMRAELAGESPLRAKELDIRARTVEERVLFGVDIPGLASAFDGPVFARKLKFEETLSPASWKDARKMIKASREKLLESGRAVRVEDPTYPPDQEDMPSISIQTLVNTTVTHLNALAITALAATTFRSVEEAMSADGSNPVKRAMARKLWIEEKLDKLIPGRRISLPHPADDRFQRQAIVVGLIPPPERKESQLAQWKVRTLAPGETNTVDYTLSSLLERSLTTSQQAGGTQGHPVWTASAQVVLGSDLMADEGCEATRYMRMQFDNAPRGKRTRHAAVLTGNMYLASEFASDAKLGVGVIYTDERGLRHRGVLLKREFSVDSLRFMPVRLWNRQMISKLFAVMAEGQVERNMNGAYRVYTSFRAAYRTEPGPDNLIFDGQNIVMSTDKGSFRRVLTMLRAIQKVIREEAYPGQKPPKAADDPDYVRITDASKKSRRGEGVGVFALDCSTPGKLERAVRMLMEGPGLQVYVANPRSSLGQLASTIMREFFYRRAAERAGADEEKLREAIEEYERRMNAELNGVEGMAELIGTEAPQEEEIYGATRVDLPPEEGSLVDTEPESIPPDAEVPEAQERPEEDSNREARNRMAA
jgi:hypothetical protein